MDNFRILKIFNLLIFFNPWLPLYPRAVPRQNCVSPEHRHCLHARLATHPYSPESRNSAPYAPVCIIKRVRLHRTLKEKKY